MNTVKHTAEFQIGQSATLLFPLFSAEGEKFWVPGWDYINVMGTTDLHEDYVFITESHDHASGDAIWIVKTHQPENLFVEYYKVEPGDKVGIIAVHCTALSDCATRVSVSYEYIALTETGVDFIKTFTNQVYQQFIGEWKELLEAYFAK